MRIAIAQLNYTIGDFEGNKLKIMDAVARARSDGADLVVFAEQAISGVPAYELLNKVNFLDQCEDALVEIASCPSFAPTTLERISSSSTGSAPILIVEARISASS